MNINFLQNIYVPILIGDKRQKGITSFRKDYEYKYANMILILIKIILMILKE